MKKTFSLVTVFMITLFTLAFGHTVFADEEESSTIVPDKVSTIDYTIKHEINDEDSAANSFFNKPADLLDINGERYVQLTVNSWEMIDSLQTENGDVLVVKENNDDGTTLIQFKVDGSLSDVINLNMHITVPGLYSMEHDARLLFKVETEKEVEVGHKEIITSDGGNGPKPEIMEPEQPEDSEDPDPSEPEQPEENESDQSIIDLEDGSYLMEVSYLRDDNDDPSSMGRYMDDSVFLTVKENTAEVTITINDDKTVTKLQVDGKDAIEKVVDGDKRYETFTFDSLESLLDAYVEYQAPFGDSIHYGNAAFRMSFDQESVRSADASAKPGMNIDGDKDQDKDIDQDVDEDDNKDKDKDKDKDTDKNSNKDEDKVISSQPDKVYEIDYIVKHATEDKVSSADSFFKKPAYLLYKDGEKYLQLTVTNSDMIKSLRADNYDVFIVKENSDGSMVIQFKIDGDISQVINLNMFVSVPDMPGAPGGYDMEHDARLFLDTTSMIAVDASKFFLITDSEENLNGPIVDEGNSGDTVEDNNGDKSNGNGQGSAKKDNTPAKPTFDTKSETHDKDITQMKGNKTENPKTGDTNQIFFLSLLLIISLIPLAIKARKRFV